MHGVFVPKEKNESAAAGMDIYISALRGYDGSIKG